MDKTDIKTDIKIWVPEALARSRSRNEAQSPQARFGCVNKEQETSELPKDAQAIEASNNPAKPSENEADKIARTIGFFTRR